MLDDDLPLSAPANAGAEPSLAEQAERVTERQRLAEMRLHLDAFLHSPTGGWLLDKARITRQAALEELAKANPSGADHIRFLQDTVRRVDSLEQWLNELIFEGNQAVDELSRPSDDD